MLHYSPGTLIHARRRLWRVDGQEGSILYVTAVDENTCRSRIYLPMESVQPGQLEWPDPKHVGYPQAHDLMLRAFKFSMMHSTAPLLSLQRSRAIPVAYQLVPVVMSLEQPRVRLLIADDIGLGKTVEAGLVISELMARGLARRLLVVCPASLRDQWKHALDYFFHLEALIFSRTHRRAIERDLPAGANPWEFQNVYIVSVDYAKNPEIKNQILEVPWDIVVVDETHQIAKPHQASADQPVKMDRWQLGKALAQSPNVKHLLLLTATPHNGYTDSFASLLRLLDVDAVSGPEHDPRICRQIAQRHVVQRRRQDVLEWLHGSDGNGKFPERDQQEIVIRISPLELEVMEAVNRYGELVLKNASGARTQIQTLAGWAVLHLHKRALSSPEALRRSLRNRRAALQQRLQGLTEEEAGLPFDVARANVLDEDTGEQFDEEEIVDRSEKVVPGDPNALRAELRALDQLEELAGKITPAKDSKLAELLRNQLRPMLARRHKAIIFTRYRDTMEYVAEQIGRSPLYEHVRVVTLHGGMNENQRQERFAMFEGSKDAVLVATDAISEGVNLQYLASQIIHYELPWNPNRLEQRNGRVDRFGQPEDLVYIRTLVLDETLDATILKVMLEKTRRIRADYGFSPPYFGDETNILDFIRSHGVGLRLGPQQLELFETFSQDDFSPDDPFDKVTLDRIKNESFYGQSDISLGVVEEQMRQVAESVGTPDEIRQFVLSGLNRMNCTVRENQDGTLRIIIQHPDLRLPGIDAQIERATFDPKLGIDQPDVDVLDLGHPLVRRLMDLIKREAFQPDSAQETTRYGRTAVVLTGDVEEMTALYTLLVRYVTKGQPPQILEDLLTVALPVYADQPLSAAEAVKLSQPLPAAGQLSLEEKQEVLTDALKRSDLNQIMDSQIRTRREQIEASRRKLRESLNREADWLHDADQLTLSSWDLLAVKVLWPK